ncbi:DsbE family thiol:disulfide interchange protein [Thiohalobacter sp. IOR34]|uniref:DsbE family thiol:disulfide interchange protein n=1 Tax=Thiohalobacter sp. IOR34 TaxID=3057176 RepID=UPI0025AF3207|nr:DsbE family thiol:disulfide interchange protein [Thiohalobacter sp. IOR34]WJW76493.1 DsbE family thiol:disulfide interchange protein [Thiohalobacter sp. IOR34]
MNRYLLPLGIFAVLVVLLAVGLGLDPRKVPSPLIDKPAPAFSLPRLHQPEQSIGTADMKGKVWLLNVWASWCSACRSEHPLVIELGRRAGIEIVGLDYKDQREDALRWLRMLGDPYTSIAFDADGRVGIDWGVYGVPESFLIDKQGIIRYKQIGPIDRESLEETLLPMIRQLQEEPA